MKMKNVLRLAVVSAAIYAGFAQAAVQTTYLATARPLIKFNELTPQEKIVLAEQAQLLLRDLYVNRQQKKNYYGTAPNSGYIEPAERAASLLAKARAGSISTTDLHKGLSEAFVAQRDLHLNYNFPLPHSAFISFLPLDFARTSSASNPNEVRIGAVYFNASTWTNSFGQRRPVIGDEVLEYDGIPIQQAVQNAVVNGNGANLFGGFSRALQYLTFTWQGAALPPANNYVRLKLRAAATGEEYTITSYWMVQYDDADLTPSLTASTSKTAKTAKTAKELKALASKAFNMSNEPIQERYNRFVAQLNDNAPKSFAKTSTAEPSIKYAKVPRNGKSVGYISLSTFAPNGGFGNSLNIIAGLLRNELADTDALVFDVRNNGGGYISYADMLPQMFMPRTASTNSARLLNTSLNYRFLNREIFQIYWPDWVNIISKAQGTKDLYTKTGIFTTPEEANSIGQLYYKPVGVLMNARSYSATDLFTCSMRDNGAAIIYGEDPKTGAGGANVLEQDFFAYYGDDLFQPLPGGVSMRVSWRQSIRSGLAAGTMIEDQGCNADVQVPRVTSDLSNGDETQFFKVADDLLSRAPSKASYNTLTHSNFVPVGDTINLSSNSLTLRMNVINTTLVKLYVDGVFADVVTVANPATARSITFNRTIPNGSHTISIVGTTSSHVPLWNTKRNVEVSGECITACIK